MRVQSKRWFRRNRRKYPKLVKVLQRINREYPDFAHMVEIQFRWCSPRRVTVMGWYNDNIIVSSTVSGSVVSHKRKDVLEVYGS